MSKYKEKATGNLVDVKQCQHSGMLLKKNGFEAFNDGDWIIKDPKDLYGDRELRVMKHEDFMKYYTRIEKKTTNDFWSELIGAI